MQHFEEPEWGAPLNVETKCGNSLVFVKDPYMITGFLTQWIRALFYRADNIENTHLRGYLWNENAKLSRITIDPSFQDNPETERRRPGIYVKRKQISHSTPGMKGGLHTFHTGTGGFFRGKDYSSIVSGRHDILCLGDTEAEADNLSIEVFNNFLRYADAVREAGGLKVFWPESLGETQHAEGKGKSYWIGTVSLSWHYSYRWTLDREAPILKEVGFVPSLKK